MSSPLDGIFGGAPDPRILKELERIRVAVELSAALQAYAFFRDQGSSPAAEKLKTVIQRTAARLISNQP